MAQSKEVFIFQGGWEGHQPAEVSALYARELEAAGCKVRVDNTLALLEDAAALAVFDLIIPCWTCGELSPLASDNLRAAVAAGCGLAGFHGGMGDAFRKDLQYQWMVGGQFVEHPPQQGPYTVRVLTPEHPLMHGLGTSFAYHSEIYWMMIDPSIQVLADTDYFKDGHRFTVPVVWTKHWGQGRVFYSALGHCLQEFHDHPAVRALTVRGMLWAAR